MRRWAGSLVVILSMGCGNWFSDGDDDEPEEEPQELHDPPTLSIDVPQWPPIGPDASVWVEVGGAVELDSLEFRFRNDGFVPLDGTQNALELSGERLGEGFGTLQVVVRDIDGFETYRDVNDLLVDLTPPELGLGEAVLRRATDSELELWVGDAWILGGVEVEVDGHTMSESFPQAFGHALGDDWDYALVGFPSVDFEEGEHTLRVRAWDAAGNETSEEMRVRFDGTPPLVEILAPFEGQTVGATFELDVASFDPGDHLTWIEVSMGGTPIATGVGPRTVIDVDASDIVEAGELELEVVAIDEAGNRSEPAMITVNFEPVPRPDDWGTFEPR